MRRLAAVAAGAGWGAVLAPAAVPLVAAQPAPEHRAAVIVDTGAEVKRVCVRFTEPSLTGIEALVRAGTDPVVRAFAGKGAAVCALCGTGCPGDESCLTCDPGGRFWSYSRAAAGTAALRSSGAGASSTTVRDGDVEGWRWGTGGTPPFATVAEVCGEAAPPTAAPAATTPAGTVPATTVATTATATTAPPPSRATAAPGRGAPSTVTASPSSTTVPAAAAPPDGAAPPGISAVDTTTTSTAAVPTGGLAARPGEGRDGDGAGGGSPWGLAAFVAALAGLAAWSAAARRRRRRDPGG